MRTSIVALIAFAMPLLSGCGTTPAPTTGLIRPAPVAAQGQDAFATAADAEYRLRSQDVISVAVFREPDLSAAEVTVGADGRIAMPLVGSIEARGLTASELSARIASSLARGYLNNPQVAVNVTKYQSHVVTVEGAVKRPGVYPFQPGAQLSSAIAQAEGLDRVARRDQIAVFRPTAEGMTVAKFDYAAMQQGTMIDPVIEPGDRVVVGTSGLSQFWQDTLKALPLFALFTQI